jgi:hypothetical protein
MPPWSALGRFFFGQWAEVRAYGSVKRLLGVVGLAVIWLLIVATALALPINLAP